MQQDLFGFEKMTFNRLRLEYALEGNSNSITWKDLMEEVLDENGLLEYIKTNFAKAVEYDAQNLSQKKKDVDKARRIILEGVQDHIVSNFHGKETLFTMWKALIEFFKNSSDHRKLTLKDKI